MIDADPAQAPGPFTPEPRRPRLVGTALALVAAGAVIAALDLVANTIGQYSAILAWREHIDDYQVVLLILTVPAVLNIIALSGTVWLLRRTARRNRSGRLGLAVLMFCCVPGAVVNYSITELLLLAWTLSDWSSQGRSEVPHWAAALLGGSLVADAVLLLIALGSGILLVLPGTARYIDRS